MGNPDPGTSNVCTVYGTLHVPGYPVVQVPYLLTCILFLFYPLLTKIGHGISSWETATNTPRYLFIWLFDRWCSWYCGGKFKRIPN